MPKAKPKKKPVKKAKAKPKKNAVAKNAPKLGKLVGRVTHYFDAIKVGVIKMSLPLAVGDEIRVVGGASTDFTQEIVSMQVDHEPVKKAAKGVSVGMKVKEKVREGYRVYKV